jgi:hypothetical protein
MSTLLLLPAARHHRHSLLPHRCDAVQTEDWEAVYLAASAYFILNPLLTSPVCTSPRPLTGKAPPRGTGRMEKHENSAPLLLFSGLKPCHKPRFTPLLQCGCRDPYYTMSSVSIKARIAQWQSAALVNTNSFPFRYAEVGCSIHPGGKTLLLLFSSSK